MSNVKKQLSPYFAIIRRQSNDLVNDYTGIVIGTYKGEPIVLAYIPMEKEEPFFIRFDDKHPETQAIKICSDTDNKFHLFMKEFPLGKKGGLDWFGQKIRSDKTGNRKGVIIFKELDEIQEIQTTEVQINKGYIIHKVNRNFKKESIMSSINDILNTNTHARTYAHPVFDESGLLVGFMETETKINKLLSSKGVNILPDLETELKIFIKNFNVLINEVKKGNFFRNQEVIFLEILKSLLKGSTTNSLSPTEKIAIGIFENTLDSYETEFFNVIHKSVSQIHKDNIWAIISKEFKNNSESNIISAILLTWACVQFVKKNTTIRIPMDMFDEIVNQLSQVKDFYVFFSIAKSEDKKTDPAIIVLYEDVLKRKIKAEVWELASNLIYGKEVDFREYGELFRGKSHKVAKALRFFPSQDDKVIVESIEQNLNFNHLYTMISLSEYWLMDATKKENSRIKLGDFQ